MVARHRLSREDGVDVPSFGAATVLILACAAAATT